MNILKSAAKKALRKVSVFMARGKMKHMRSIKISPVTSILVSLEEALNNKLLPIEKNWIDEIEKLRNNLNTDSSKIEIKDFGAGNPELNRSQDEMYTGVTKTMTVSSISSSASKPPFFALILFKLVRIFKPETLIELGTCLGISASYQAAAQKINGKGATTTIEGAKSLASLSEKNFKKLGLDNISVVCGRFQDKLPEVLKKNQPIDFAFIDGHHDEEATISYFESFLPYLSKKAVIIFDDISWSDGMRQAWNKISKHENIKICIDLRAVGICLIDNEIDDFYKFRIPLI